MAEWWEKPYPRASRPAFKGELPRSLYPPDAGKGNFSGPDVSAYKRAVSRAGRWPWQPFDDAYSNAFSHGNGPNVADTGVAGFQRQMGIDGTGNMGRPTFDALNNSLVPEGLPNAGRPLFDKTAVDLLKQAADEAEVPRALEDFYDWLGELESRQMEVWYSMARPIQPLKDKENPPKYPLGLDCSGSLIYVSWISGMPSPTTSGYDGYGNTDSMRVMGRKVDPADAARLSTSQRVFAFYDNPGHVVACLPDGRVWSHGREAGPDYISSIWYRGGFVECRSYPN